MIWETASLSQTPHFRIGGSIHFVTNNQIAYTAEAHIGRSSVNCTDLAKAIDSPVIHVNGNYPEVLLFCITLLYMATSFFRI